MRLVTIMAALLLQTGATATASPAPEAGVVYITPTMAARLELLDAIERAKALADQRWAFTAAFEDIAEAPGRVVRARFDPRKPAGERWSLVSEQELSKKERQAFERLTRNDEADDALVYDRLGESVDGAAINATPETATFRLKIDDPKMSDEMRGALSAIATFDRRTEHVSDITVSSRMPFKPAPVAKVEKMRQVQRYAPVGPDGAVLMTEVESIATGSAMLKKFNARTRIVYSDFEKVDAEPFKRPDAAAAK